MSRNLNLGSRLSLIVLLWGALLTAPLSQALAGGDITDSNVAERLASAQSAADHEALATYFRGQAAAAGEKAKVHESMLTGTNNMGNGSASWEMHCRSLIKTYKDAQKEADALAAEHASLAKAATK